MLINIHELNYLCGFFGDVKKFPMTEKFSKLKIDVEDLFNILLCFKTNYFFKIFLINSKVFSVDLPPYSKFSLINFSLPIFNFAFVSLS